MSPPPPSNKGGGGHSANKFLRHRPLKLNLLPLYELECAQSRYGWKTEIYNR